MADICITAPRFDAADALRAALSERGLDVSLGFRPTCHTLVQGGPVSDQAALVEAARKLAETQTRRQEVEADLSHHHQRGRILGDRIDQTRRESDALAAQG